MANSGGISGETVIASRKHVASPVTDALPGFRRGLCSARRVFFVLVSVIAIVLSLNGCAASAPRDSASTEPLVDAVLPTGDGWRVFRLGALRHARVDGTPDAWPDGNPTVAEWQTIAAPSGPFRPVQAVPAQRGYFHLIDAASARLCLYDADAALLSTYPLPEEFTPFPAGRAAVFRGADGAFTFLDYGAGEAWQFADRQTTANGTTRWVPRGQVKLPAGLRDCVQPPGETGLYCQGGDGEPVLFDGALNRTELRRAQVMRSASQEKSGMGIRAVWDTSIRQWSLEGYFGESSVEESREDSTAVLFRHYPASRQLRRHRAMENGDEPARLPR